MPCACGSPGTQKETKRKRERKKEYKKKRKKGKKKKRKIHFLNYTLRIFFSLKLIRYRGIELILVLPLSKVRIQTRIHQTCSLSAKFTHFESREDYISSRSTNRMKTHTLHDTRDVPILHAVREWVGHPLSFPTRLFEKGSHFTISLRRCCRQAVN